MTISVGGTRSRLLCFLMRFIQLLLLSGYLMRSCLEEEFEQARKNENLDKIIESIEKIVQPRWKFILKLPCAWNWAHLKSRKVLIRFGVILYLSLIIIPILRLGVLENVMSSTLGFAAIVGFLVMFSLVLILVFLKASIDSDSDPGLLWLKLWIIVRSYLTGTEEITVKFLGSQLERLVDPVHGVAGWIRVQNIRKGLGVIGFALLIVAPILFVVAAPAAPDPVIRSLYQLYFVLLIVVAMMPLMIGVWLESMKRPLRLSMQEISSLLEDRKSGDSVLVARDLEDHFGNQAIQRCLQRKARWFYYFGVLSGWNYELFPLAAFVVIAASIGTPLLIMNMNLLQASGSNPMGLVSASLLMLVMLLALNLGKEKRAKIKARRNLCKALKEGKRLEDLVTPDLILTSFEIQRYLPGYRARSFGDMVVQWYIKEVTRQVRAERGMS